MAQSRMFWLGLALLATVVASVLEFPADEAVAPVPAARRSPPAGAPVVQLPVQPSVAPVVSRARFSPAAGDLFVARSWQPLPPLSALAPAAALAPGSAAEAADAAAPPLPFRYLGKLMHDGVVTAFLGQGTLTHVAGKGDMLAGYRVEEITASEMTFIHLRLNERQRLAFGSAL